jgi:hypothetical protein
MTKVLARVNDPILATVWRDLLVSAGIRAEVTGRAMNSIYGFVPTLGDVELLVADDDYDEARRLLADIQAGRVVDDPEEPADRG